MDEVSRIMGFVTYPIVCPSHTEYILPAMLPREGGTKSYKSLFHNKYGKVFNPLDRKRSKKKRKNLQSLVTGVPLLKVRFLLLLLLLVVFIYSLIQGLACVELLSQEGVSSSWVRFSGVRC